MMWARYPGVLTTNLLSNHEESGSAAPPEAAAKSRAPARHVLYVACAFRPGAFDSAGCISGPLMCIIAAVGLQQVSPAAVLVADASELQELGSNRAADFLYPFSGFFVSSNLKL